MTLAYNGPLPAVTSLNRPYWEGLRRHELSVPRCDNCSIFWLPPGPWCPGCWSRQFTWTAVSGRGTVTSWVRFHKRYFHDGAFDVPYAVVEVTLAEGPRVYANLVDHAGEAPTAGLSVEVCFEDVADDLTLARFRPTGERTSPTNQTNQLNKTNQRGSQP